MQVRAKRGNEIWSLSHGNPYYRIMMSGVGLPPSTRFSRRGSFQDGVTDRGFRVDPRELNMAFISQAATNALADEYRDTLAEIFKPTDTPISIEVTRDDGAVRQIDVHVRGVFDFPDNPLDDRMDTTQRVMVRLEAPDPTWYDPSSVNVTLEATLTGNYVMEVPFDVPLSFTSEGDLDATEPINYAGSWREYPRIYVTGPATDLVIENLTTGEKLDFDGHTIAGGEEYEIDLRYERKTIEDSSGVSQVDHLTDDSDKETWHLATSPTAVDGVNSIKVTASSTTNATRVRFLYFNRYISL